MLSEIKKIVKHGLACAQRYGASAGLRLMARLELAHRAKGLSSVEIPGLKNPTWLRPRTSDVETLIQVFVLAEYDVFGTRQYAWLSNRYEEIVSGGGRPLIIDCGANIGLSAIWFSSRYPKAEIVAVEPDDGNLAVMRRNLAHYPNVRIVQGGVWDASCRLSVINPDAQPWAYITERGESGGIAAYTIDELSEGRPIFIAKIDIEGSEQALFRSNDAWIGRTDMVVIELHDWRFPGRRTSANFFKRIAREDFEFLSTPQNLFFFLYRERSIRPVAAALLKA